MKNKLTLFNSVTCNSFTTVFVFGRKDVLFIGNEKLFGDLYCGENTGETVVVKGNYAVLYFQSDSVDQRRGYLIYFSPVLSSKYINILAW